MKKLISITVALFMICTMFSFVGCIEEEPKVFVWDEIVLKDQLPEPNTNLGECVSNTEERLNLRIVAETETSYSAYVQASKNKGFTIDPKTIGDSYDAYNTEGYKISLSNIGDTIYIELDAPMKVSQIIWPTAEYAKVIPIPASTTGKISHENSDGFLIYIANTTIDEYNSYVQDCSDKGFNVDYSKSEDYYRAKNAEGYTLSISYEGFNIICIDLDCPEKNIQSDSSDKVSSSNTTTDSDVSNDEVSDGASGDISADFKEAMDSYEEFMNEYVEFMKKYKANPSDLSLIAKYATIMNKYYSFSSDFSKWKNEDLNSAELEYYLQVQSRVTKKLLEVAE